jgi:hypothetical protein
LLTVSVSLSLPAAAGDKECALDAPTWPVFHAKYEKEMFRNGMSAVNVSLQNTRRIHAPVRTWGLAMMRFMGACVKCANLLTTGKYSL